MKTLKLKAGYSWLPPFQERIFLSCLFLVNILFIQAKFFDAEKSNCLIKLAEIYWSDSIGTIRFSEPGKKGKIYIKENTIINCWDDGEVSRRVNLAFVEKSSVYISRKGSSKNNKISEKIVKQSAEILIFPVNHHSVIFWDPQYPLTACQIKRISDVASLYKEEIFCSINLEFLYATDFTIVYDGFLAGSKLFGVVNRTRPPPCFVIFITNNIHEHTLKN